MSWIHRSRRVRLGTVAIAATICLFNVSPADAATPAEEARLLLEQSGITGGFVVHLGCGNGEATAALRTNDRFQVQGLSSDAAQVAEARERLTEQGSYGPVAVDTFDGQTLPYIDNLVNLVVVDGESVARDELLRVLTPNGVAMIRDGDQWSKLTKPWPEEIDDWTHYLYDSKGNAVAHDQRAGPPRHLQWLGSPRWSRHHDRMASMSALVSARGRIFYIMDEGSRVSIQLPPRWTLLARDAFNGTILWRQPIPEWQNHLWPLKSGPTQLARRLVAVGDRVFVTLGFHAPVTMIDAGTGETRRVFEATAGTEELLVNNGLLLAQVNRGAMETDDYAPALNVGDQGRVAREYAWNQKPREIMAIDIETGETLWSRETTMAPLTMTLDEQRAYFHDGQKVVCLDRKTGDQLWTSEPAARRQTITMNFGPKLVVYKSVVLFAGGDRTMKAFDSATGKHLWTAPHAQSGYQSPEDLLVANGLVWSAPTTRTQDSGIYSGLDPLTGEVKVEFPPAVDTYWFHHRCYIAKGTDRFIMPSRTGVEFVDTLTQKWDIHHWVRGGCLYGVMPANGLVYAPPHNCACYPEAKLYGFNALAAANEDRLPPAPEDIDNENRLQRGPAYNEPLAPLDDEARLADWPTYRHDNARSGSSPSEGPAALDAAWQTELGGRLSAVTVADGRLYVSQVDAHTLHALDAISGDKLWRFTAGGRIDSPPTIHQGRVLFGSADGYVYSLRASDGALVWRFRGAPTDRRLMAMEQLESVWPVHGSVLIEDGVASFIAGRSNFLDGGMRLIRLDAVSGQKLSETVLDDRDPDTGENLQTRLQVLQMPVGLSDILTSDGESIYLRSQMFDREGNRLKMGPHSGQAERHGGTQKGEGRHLFAPTGFLDDTWFHRSYWVYGRSFAGGHNGYYQAGRFTPSGRMLVFNDEYVFGFARKPQYYRWTTIMEHELFRSSKEAADEAYGDSENPTEDAPTTPRPGAARGGATGRQSNANAGGRQANNQANNPRPNNGQSGNNNGRQRGNKATADSIHFGVLPKLDPTGKPLTVELWVNAEQPAGVLLAHGGPQNGYALVIRGGKAGFDIRAENQLTSITSSDRIVGRWAHVVGVLDEQKQMRLYVDGKLVAEGKSSGLISSEPKQGLDIGVDDASSVGEYASNVGFVGLIDDVSIYHTALNAEQVAARFADPHASIDGVALALRVSFDKADAQDESPHKLAGVIQGAISTPGKFSRAMKFRGGGTAAASNNRQPAKGSFVEHHWNQDLPMFVSALALAGKTLYVAGPPDMVNEEESFARLTERDPRVQEQLAQQAAALEGQQGSLLWAVRPETGERLATIQLPALPTWDGMAAARGRLYLSTQDGKITCWTERP